MKRCNDCVHAAEPFGHPPCNPCLYDEGKPNFVAVVSAAPGRKDDSAKLDMTLVIDDLPHALEGVAEVLQWAITKKQPVPYQRGSWQGVEPFQARYRAASMRHEISLSKGKLSGKAEHEITDYETGLLELAHIATDALFRLEMAMRARKAANA